LTLPAQRLGFDPQLYLDLLQKVGDGAERAGRDRAQIRRMIEIKVSYDRDQDRALEDCNFWAPLALTLTPRRWRAHPQATTSAPTSRAGKTLPRS
jgi:alkanesulfonate monooxygenase SsuD/methylene tetrahydromethanopterin reductase-like flavin-dependent oxidoreductase (luciferase family)